jgi:peptidoglycan/LPS O-acetylase OafA/YrhL
MGTAKGNDGIKSEGISVAIVRVDFLDGIRGWASLMVLFSHLIMAFLALSTVEYQKRYLLFISDGHLAVLTFFVLSGYALSAGHVFRGKGDLALSTVARYFRLCVPIFVTTMLAYVLLELGLFFNLKAAISPATSLGWLGTFYKFDPSFVNALKFSFFDVFFSYDGGSTYNASLWTMPIELAGSLVIYAYLGIFRNTSRVFWLPTLAFAIYLQFNNPFLSCFVFGYLIAELNFNFRKVNSVTLEGISILLFSSVPIISTFYRPTQNWKTSLMAVVLVLSVSYSKYLRAFFTCFFSRFLGKISFPLYLIQVPIICSWSSYLFLKLPQQGFGNFFAPIC